MEEQTHVNFGQALLAIHHCITRGLETAQRHSLAYAEGDSPEKPAPQGLVDYVSTLVTVLHGHHLVEDELVFPTLKGRLPGAPYDSLVQQHLQIDPFLDAIRSEVDRAGAAPGIAEPWRKIGQALAGLIEIWHPHIGVEETNFTPVVVDENFSREEQDSLVRGVGRLNQQHLLPPELAVPFTLLNMEPADRAVIANTMPQVMTQQLVPVVWRARWEPMMPYLLP